MHYTNAVIHESFRVTSFIPVSVPHSAMADVKVRNYVIPKGGLILDIMESFSNFRRKLPYSTSQFLEFREHPHMTSADFEPFLTYPLTVI